MGASSVTSMRIVVVLPAPLGPRKPKISPCSHGEIDAGDRLDVTHLRAEHPPQPGRLDHPLVAMSRTFPVSFAGEHSPASLTCRVSS